MAPTSAPEGSRKPLVVALLGPAGAGKSAAREAFARRGAATLCFDDYSRDLLVPGMAEYGQVRREFGAEVLQADGSLDRAALGARVFSDPRARERLNAIVHPPMLERLRAAIAEFRSSPTAPLLVVEGAILGQLPTEGWFDRTVMVTASPEVRAARLQEGKGLSEEAAGRLIRLHEEMGVGREQADHTLHNEGDLGALERLVEELWGRLTKNP